MIFEEWIMVFEQYIWLAVFVVSMAIRDSFIEQKAYIYTPQGYYWLGMLTMWLMMYAADLPVG